MKNTTYLFIIVALFAVLSGCQQNCSTAWPEQSQTSKPWTRWWWMGSAVDKQNITDLLTAYSLKGIGGVEITPIYGAKGFEDNYLEFLSEEWMKNLYTVINVADSLGMGVDMNLGTGWPYGGPHIEPEFAATRMIVQNYNVKKGQQLKTKILVGDEKQAKLDVKLNVLMAYSSENALDLTTSVNESGELIWTADSDYELYALFTGKTRQQVKRAAPGGKGFVMDHLNEEAFKQHTARFEQAYGDKIPGVRSYFNDSYEVYGADFTASFFDDFEKLRGYDLKPYLPLLLNKDTTDMGLRIKSDYRKTMGELLLSNFTNPWVNWSNEKGALTRNQAHGSPANLLDVYAAVDIPECETFGYTGFDINGAKNYTHSSRHTPPDPFMLKMASSSANILGKPLVSSETFTWLGEHFKVPLSQAKPELDQAFLSGVNHVFFHGTTYSPKEAGWPGWLFYASTNFAPSNSFWNHIEGLNNYISRCQSILQSGQPQGDILLYFPYDDVVHYSGKNRLEYLFTVHNIPEWLHPTSFYQLAKDLTEQGYTVDYLSDDLLGKLTVENGKLTIAGSGSTYKALVIPGMEFMNLESLKNIEKLNASGAKVVLEEMPKDVPGWNNLDQRRNDFSNVAGSLQDLQGDVKAYLKEKNVLPEPLVNAGLKYIRRVDEQGVYYLLVNHQPDDKDAMISFNTDFENAIILDPNTGKTGNAETSGDKVRVQIQSGESLFVRLGSQKASKGWKYINAHGDPVQLANSWILKFLKGGPALPEPTVLNEGVKLWTELGNESMDSFSGVGAYRTTFTIEKEGEYVLDLGDVRESAAVWINDQFAGNSWCVPHKMRIGEFVKKGENHIRIEVANLMANRIRYMDKEGIEWKKYHEINFVNIDYKHFDASDWEVQPSGLAGPVRLISVE